MTARFFFGDEGDVICDSRDRAAVSRLRLFRCFVLLWVLRGVWWMILTREGYGDLGGFPPVWVLLCCRMEGMWRGLQCLWGTRISVQGYGGCVGCVYVWA